MTIFIEEPKEDLINGLNKSNINKSFDTVNASHRFSKGNIELKTIYKSLNQPAQEVSPSSF